MDPPRGGADTEYVRTVRVESSLLSRFWGQPMLLEACVLLPYGFADHPDARCRWPRGEGWSMRSGRSCHHPSGESRDVWLASRTWFDVALLQSSCLETAG